MNLFFRLYYEFEIIFELLTLFLKKYFSGFGSITLCLIESVYNLFDFNFFRVVESSVGKYISVQNIEKNCFDIAINFGSYDYMGFSNFIEDREKLIKLYEKNEIKPSFEITKLLETKITYFLEKENDSDTVIINGGYQGNSDYLPYVLDNYSILISHHDNHASIIKGIKKSNIKSLVFYSLENLEYMLKLIDFKKEKVIVIIEGIYSMTGNISELPDYMKLKEKYPYHLYIDEAHSCGCIGKSQKGICDFYNIDPKSVEYLMGTFSKTFNAHGSYVCGPKEVISQLRTARDNTNDNILPSISAKYILSIYDYLQENHDYIDKKFSKIVNYAFDEISKNKEFNVVSTRGSPVICIKVLYGRGRLISKHLIKNNIATVVVGHPAVKLPYLIVRICVSIVHTYDDIDYLISCLKLNTDKNKLKLPERDSLKYFNEDLECKDILKSYSLGSSGPSGFFGYMKLNQKLENIINSITKKNTCIFMPNSKSGFSDSIENIIKRYKYKYVCIDNSIKDKVENIVSKIKQCEIIKLEDFKNYNKVLTINFPSENSLKIVEDINDNFESYKFVVGKLNEVCGGMGCFWSYNDDKYCKIQKRTAHSSYVFSANLPAYVINHNIVKINELINKKNLALN